MEWRILLLTASDNSFLMTVTAAIIGTGCGSALVAGFFLRKKTKAESFKLSIDSYSTFIDDMTNQLKVIKCDNRDLKAEVKAQAVDITAMKLELYMLRAEKNEYYVYGEDWEKWHYVSKPVYNTEIFPRPVRNMD